MYFFIVRNVKQLVHIVSRVDNLKKVVSEIVEEIRKLPSLEEQITEIADEIHSRALQKPHVSFPSTKVIAEI